MNDAKAPAADAGGKPKRQRRPRPPKPPPPPPDFISAAELARRMCVERTETLDEWVAIGKLPPPWVYAGPRKRLWRRDHYEAFYKTGKWPLEAFNAG